MKVSSFLYTLLFVVAGFTVASGNDTTATVTPDSQKLSAKLTNADSTAATDAFVAFSAINKKYLKKSIITNVLYLGGFGLYMGVVTPGIKRAGNNSMDVLKWVPLSYLSVGMMYASIPINVISSYRARSNYKYYYKTAPTNFALPILLTGAGLCIGAAGSSVWNSVSDYRDNKEFDLSYNKYGKLATGLLNAGFISFACSNIYSLVYTVVLGEKAKQHSAPATASLQLAPMRYGNANGAMLTWNF